MRHGTPQVTDRPRHTLFEDAQGILSGTLMCAFALHLLTSAGLMTGQTAGLAILIGYATGWPFAPVFVAVNLPFYWLAWRRMGPRFTIKTFVAVALVAGFSTILPPLIGFDHASPLAAALIVGVITGPGLIALFRHGASLGGIGILAVWLQDSIGWRAGWVQLGFDAALFAAALFVMAPGLVLCSLAGAAVLNVIVAINHRRDRYIAL